MMSGMLYRLKGSFQKVAAKFAGSSITANHASLAGVVLFLGVAACFYFSPQSPWLLLLIPVLSFFRFIANALDGLIARAQGTATPAGEVLNEMSDVLGDTISYGILFFVFPAHATAVFVFVIAIWFCELAGIMAKNLPNGVRGQESLGGAKPERAVFLSLYAVYLYVSPEAAAGYLGLFLYVLSVLVFLSGIQRVVKSIKRSRGTDYTSHTSYGD
jgi:phosphatidylglycerophosphate synthase